MPDTVSIDGEPIEVTGDVTPADIENGRILAAEVATVLLYLYLFGRIDRTGRPISDRVILSSIDKLVGVTGGRIEIATRQLLAGTIDLATWQRRMRNILRAGTTISGVVNRGGLQAMTRADWISLGRSLGRQMVFLNNFARQLADGMDASEAQIIARARSYANSIRSAGQQMILDAAIRFNADQSGWAMGELQKIGKAVFKDDRHLIDVRRTGTSRDRTRAERKMRQFIRVGQAQAQRVPGEYMEARRVLGIAEHCEGCIFWAAQGWIPAEIVPPLFTQECMSHCKCTIQTRVAQGIPAAIESSDRYRNPPEIVVRL